MRNKVGVDDGVEEVVVDCVVHMRVLVIVAPKPGIYEQGVYGCNPRSYSPSSPIC